jgi:hypothetical protein
MKQKSSYTIIQIGYFSHFPGIYLRILSSASNKIRNPQPQVGNG